MAARHDVSIMVSSVIKDSSVVQHPETSLSYGRFPAPVKACAGLPTRKHGSKGS
jgi:hypothetical protein